jgi:hypothetical protein
MSRSGTNRSLTHDQHITVYHANTTSDYAHEEWGFSATAWSKNSVPVRLEALDFPKWFAGMKFNPTMTTILMKMDIEGSEYDVLAALLAQGSLCSLHTVTIEWHSRFCRGPLCNVNLPSLVQRFPNIYWLQCEVRQQRRRVLSSRRTTFSISQCSAPQSICVSLERSGEVYTFIILSFDRVTRWGCKARDGGAGSVARSILPARRHHTSGGGGEGHKRQLAKSTIL